MNKSRRFDAAMRRALELAALGPVTGGNPQVGCVLLDAAGAVIAEGWHRGAGTAHAEADALARATADGTLGSVDTAVVTLEPCAHHGRTGCPLTLAGRCGAAAPHEGVRGDAAAAHR